MTFKTRWVYGLLGVVSAMVLAMSLTTGLVGCGEDTDGGDLNGDGNTELGDVAKIVLVGQAGLDAQSDGTGEVPKEVPAGTLVVIAAVLYDKAGNPITGESAAEHYAHVTWKSSDPTVATVTTTPGGTGGGALVSTLKAGHVTITATYESLSASAEITVK
jgi:hypothetical protein